MTIDPKNLREAIGQVDATGSHTHWKAIVLAAARAHLAQIEKETKVEETKLEPCQPDVEELLREIERMPQYTAGRCEPMKADRLARALRAAFQEIARKVRGEPATAPATCETCEHWKYPNEHHSDGSCALHGISKIERDDYCSFHLPRLTTTPAAKKRPTLEEVEQHLLRLRDADSPAFKDLDARAAEVIAAVREFRRDAADHNCGYEQAAIRLYDAVRDDR